MPSMAVVDRTQKAKEIQSKIGGINIPMETGRTLGFFVNIKKVFVLIIAGGIGSRLVGIGSNDVPKQFTECNEKGETWIQVTVDRFIELGVLPSNVVVVTTNNGQTKLAEEQLISRGVHSDHIHQIGNNYDYAGAMFKGAEFINKIDKDAVVINTPSDQYIVADDNFRSTMVKAVIAAFGGTPVAVVVEIADLNLMQGCGHAIYDLKTMRVIGFVEKPGLLQAKDLLNDGNSGLNTGINVWSLKTLFEQAKSIIAKKRQADLEEVKDILAKDEKIYGKVTTKEQAEKSNARVRAEVKGWSLGTDELMSVFSNLHVVVGKFKWADCGTYDSLYKVLRKSADHKNAKIGNGKVDNTFCSNDLFFVADNYLLKAYGLKNSFVAVNSIYNRTVVVVGNMEYSQLVKEFGEKLGDDLITGHSYDIESKNCRVQSTEVEDLIVCFIGLSNHSAVAFRNENGEILVGVSNDARMEAA